jgi:DNA-directed RNA polymerase alpha subunit
MIRPDIIGYSLLRIWILGLSPRIYKSLIRAKISTLGDLLIAITNPDDLLQIEGLGKEDLEQIRIKLDRFNESYFEQNYPYPLF